MSRNAVSFMAVRRGPVRTQAVPDPDDTRPQAAPVGSVPEAPIEPDPTPDPDGASDTSTGADPDSAAPGSSVEERAGSTQAPDEPPTAPPADDVDAQAAALIQDGATLDAIVEWATGNPDRITAALAAEAASANPRKTLPARLAPTKENG